MKNINKNTVISSIIFFILWLLPSFVATTMIGCDCNLRSYGFLIFGFAAILLVVIIRQLFKTNLFQNRFAILMILASLLYLIIVVFVFASKWSGEGGSTLF
jgi:hypothetical protein